MKDGAAQTAVLLCVPEAEPLVHAWRSTGDPSAAGGIPAHVTLLAPFLPRDRLDAGVLGELSWFFGGVDAFDLHFDGIGEFPDDGVVYLEPDGDGLDDLADALARRWPETPPYRGRHARPHAHLTVVHTDDAALRTQAAQAVEQGLPLKARAGQAALWACDDAGRWSERTAFRFGPGEHG